MLSRLQTQADFDISPADILSVQRLLQTQTSLLLTPDGRIELQYLLAPILCKNQHQQAKFYAIYQTYLAEDLLLDRQAPTDNKSIKKVKSIPWFYLLIGLLGLVFFAWKIGFNKKKFISKIQFERPKKNIHIGDTLHLKNTSLINPEIPIVYEWTYFNKKNRLIEHQQTSTNFNFSIPETGQDYFKTIRLIGRDSLSNKIVGRDSMSLPIYCSNPPIINTITIGDTLLIAGTPLPFSAEVEGDHLALSWNFGDGNTSSLKTPVHTYEKNGNYLVKLTARDTSNRFGKCESSLQTYLKLAKKLKEETIAASAFTLQKEPPKTVLQSKAWTYILLMLLLTGAGWSWLQWLMRPFLEKTPRDYFKATESIQPKPLEELIQPTFLQFEIANLLRKRQASKRQEMALTKTLQATVEKGGYSKIHYQFKTKPTAYLALVELSDDTPGQQEFAKYLPDFFVKQDVLLQTFFYKNDFESIWNPSFPNGISLRKLYELFPENRLLVLGDTAQLIANWQQEKQLPATWNQLASQWQHQVICTNTTIPNSLFATLPFDTTLSFFSADLAGINQAVNYLEEKTTETTNETAVWVNQTKANNLAPAKFNQAEQVHFQNQYPELHRWILALNIYPTAPLKTIIAIGKGLKIVPTYDNLQLLIPILNLQKNNFDKSIWLNNWGKLSITDEKIARQAVATELTAILNQTTTKDIDTTTLKDNLVIQKFALNPHDINQQTQVRYLYQTGRLSDLQLTELDIIIQRHCTNYRQGKINGEIFVKFLKDARKKQQKIKPHWNTSYFWWAIGLSLVSLLLGSSMYFSKNARLKDSFKIAKSEAARLNNLAVDYYTKELPLPEKPVFVSAKSSFNFKGINPISVATEQYLGQAITIDSVFEKAHVNYQKLMYNDGLIHYQSYLKNNNYPLAKAKYALNKVIQYSTYKNSTIHHSAMLTLANIHHILNEQDSVCTLLETLSKIQNEALSASIELLKKQAVYCADQPVTILISGQVVDAKTLKGIEHVLIKQGDQQTKTDLNGRYQLQIIKAPSQANTTLSYSQKAYQPYTKNIELTSNSLTIPVIQLTPAISIDYTISGQIIDAQTRSVLPNIPIANTTSNQNGYFNYTYSSNIENEKELTIKVQAEGYLTYQKTIALSKPPSQLTIELVPQRTTLSAFNFPIPTMVLVPGGTFTMGCTPEQEYVCQTDERPAHKVKLDSFEIGKYEVTNEEFAAFLNDYGNSIKSGPYAGETIIKADPWGMQLSEDGIWQPADGYNAHPAVRMRQYGAVEYCKWLSQKTGQTWRLPTESEWEYAARGGTKSVGYVFSGGNNLETVAWCYKNSFEKGNQHPNYGTNPVGQRKSNALGIHDMSGNVFEWINGWYQEDIYEQFSNKLAVNPQAPINGERRMLRGGSWYLFSKDDARVSNRVSIPPTTQGYTIGFRVVRVLQ